MKSSCGKPRNTEKTKPDTKTQFTAVCGTLETKGDTHIVSRSEGSQNATFMGYCADCDKMDHLCTIITHYGIEKNVCIDCLKHYNLRMTNIMRPKWAGVFL